MGTKSQAYLMSGTLFAATLFCASPSLESPINDTDGMIALADVEASTCTGLCDVKPMSQTSMGRFFEREIAERVQLVSNRSWSKPARVRFAKELSQAIAKASYEHKVDPFVLLAMVEVESRYNAMAVGSVGERGLMQIKPSTARGVVPESAPEFDCNLQDIACNVMIGARYISKLEDQTDQRGLVFQSEKDRLVFVLRSYNLGPARAYRLMVNKMVNKLVNETESNRDPAQENAQDANERVTLASKGPTYAEKISYRARRFKDRYLDAATSTTSDESFKQQVTTVANAN